MYAARNGHLKVAQMLLSQGPPPSPSANDNMVRLAGNSVDVSGSVCKAGYAKLL